MQMIMWLFTLIFVIASVYQLEYYDEVKRLTSFVIFMSIFSYMFINIDEEMVKSFKVSIVIVSVYFSLISLLTLIGLDLPETAGTSAKNLVGSQRFGFIYLVGIWLTYFYKGSSKLNGLLKYAILFILLVGLFLTFSRSSIVALFGSFSLFAIVNCLIWLKNPKLKLFIKYLTSVAIVGIFVVLLYQFVPIAFTFFKWNLYSYLLDSSAVTNDLADSSSSGGTRVYIVGRIIDFLIHNPVTGSGYLGVWILDDSLFGSAHNQYADVLFRTGIFGFCAYIILTYLMLRFFIRNDRSLFWSLVSVIIYGLFHETFKESQGGFVLAFLLGMMSQSFVAINMDVVPKVVVSTGGRKIARAL